MSRPGTSESALANVVTSWPRRSSSRTSSTMTRSVPPYARGGTRSIGGATWAMRSGRDIVVPPRDDETVGRRCGPTVEHRRADGAGDVPAVAVSGGGGRRRVGLFDLFLGLVAGTGTGAGADSGTDDGARRSGDRATDRARRRRRRRARPARRRPRRHLRSPHRRRRRPRHRCRHRPPRPDRATDGHADGRATERPGAGADGLVAVLLVLGRPCRCRRRAASVDRRNSRSIRRRNGSRSAS